MFRGYTHIKKGFTLIELLVVLAIIALLSSIVAAAVAKSRIRARDTARIQNARQISLALEQYELTKGSYKIDGVGYNGGGGGFVAKGSETPGYTSTIISALASQGYYSAQDLIDPVFGTDNYYLGLCTSTNAYNVFVKLEDPKYNNATSAISNSCGGEDAADFGFSFIASTAGGSTSDLSEFDAGFGLLGAAQETWMMDQGSGSQGALAAIGVLDSGATKLAVGINNLVWTSAIQSDGKIIVGGQFTATGTIKNRLARFNQDGTLDTSYPANTGASSYIYTSLIDSNGKLLIGGQFTTVGTTTRGRIARINVDGSVDLGFATSTGANGNVRSIALQPDGKVILGGVFTTYNGATSTGIVRLNPDGSRDTSFNVGSGFTGLGAVYTIQVQSDQKIVVAGSFLNYNGSSTNNIARLNSDGSLDTTYNIGTGFSNVINSSVIQSNGKIVFSSMPGTYNGGTTTLTLFRINTDGTLDTTFTPGTGANMQITSLAVQPGDLEEKIVFGGWFSAYNGTTRNYVARVDKNGVLDTGFATSTGANAHIKTVSVHSDGSVVIGGQFTTYGGISSPYVARLK